ncbi:hypothetical protein [Paenibacillus sp. FSL L8-0709]|uniref:hypothetical protein n=1 Tax=Paenibacillus sp. FSL L8-0709 TaxID=2975312 RepID=UPI0030F4FEA9
MMMETEVLPTYQNVVFSNFRLPMIVVFDHPIDCPTKFVARLFELNVPTKYATVADNLDELRSQLPLSFNRLDRHTSDDPTIVEVCI